MPDMKKNKLTPTRPMPLTRFVKKNPCETSTSTKASPRHWSNATLPRRSRSDSARAVALTIEDALICQETFPFLPKRADWKIFRT